jgi:alkanesulfonate monooxygenase SsuD/methylene tetrahydromethanopterin reductase-like flavin-dependent oxidoreductase (luciferase family)
MQLYFFHLMPWPHIDPEVREKYGSSWVVYPNSEYDPVEGSRLYNQYLDQLSFADQIGFDAVCVNEHHQNAYGLMPSPNIMAAALVSRTKQARIAILGNGVAMRRNPLRVAEEVAMLDVMSGGRVISGFVRGIGAEYHSLSLDPTTSRDRFFEAHDLILKAWTTPGPFEWDGRFFHYRYVNVWPRPLTQPHPPIFVPSQGSDETLEWAAQHRYPLACTFVPMERLKAFYDRYRSFASEQFGYDAGPEQFGFTSLIHVDTDEKKAQAAVEPHVRYFIERCFVLPLPIFFPPGYTDAGSYRRRVTIAREVAASGGPTLNAGAPLIGTPEQVGERLVANLAEAGAGTLLAQFQVGDMPHDKVMRSMELFADKVLPYLPREARTAGAARSAGISPPA